MRKEFDKRRTHMVERLNKIKGFECLTPDGAFYVFPKISSWFGKEIGGKMIKGSLDFTDVVLDKGLVALVPGIGFGADEYVRLSYATSMTLIDKGIDRLETLLGKK